MENINDILSAETKNRCSVYLYANGDRWCAYEQSAFHFAQIFKTGKVEMRDNYLFVEVGEWLELFNHRAVCTVHIRRVANDKIFIECDCSFSDFDGWRSKTIDELS